MAFDKSTRNRLAKFVADARGVIADEFTEQFQSLYGISAKGNIAPLEKLSHLDESGLATAGLLRERVEYLERIHPDDKDGTKAAVARLAREQAFTILNRLAAIRMAEKRGLSVESVGKGYQSKGFKVFETVAGSALGDTYHRYRRYLFCLFDELAIDLGVLFDRRSPQALLFPREPALLALLDLLHAADLEPLWAEDETIGWIYQYYNDPEERRKMRKESSAPRNSRELAVRNQFFTPRYVVEFLTDNTLGRIWYEMTQGQTRLAEQCRYLVRRPTEIFLAEGENAPESLDQEGLSQEELLKQPVHIPHRSLKDPREIRLLDPACGSMHFGLYAFDLFETVYEEAWDNGSCPALQEAYPSRDEFLHDVPRLIIEHNIHGIDIDPRAVQIAGLSLWLRAQKAWQARGVKPADRPRVRRSSIVCAEPMPGSQEMLEEFVATLKPDLLGVLVKTVFDKMQLAGEAGSLLEIEEEIRTAIDTARKEWLKQQNDLLTRKDGSQEEFFDTAEQQVIDALRAYAEQADADSYQRRLFADDAARGFAFIDLCRKRYDAVVMNPPFGEPSIESTALLKKAFPSSKTNIYACFCERGGFILGAGGLLGAISSRSGFFQSSLTAWREEFVLTMMRPVAFADLGAGVLDTATVETACYVLQRAEASRAAVFIDALGAEDKAPVLLEAIDNARQALSSEAVHIVPLDRFSVIPGSPLAYSVSDQIRDSFKTTPGPEETGKPVRIGLSTKNDERFVRVVWEVPPSGVGRQRTWSRYANGGRTQPFYDDYPLVVKSEGNFAELRTYLDKKFPYLNGNLSFILHDENSYNEPAIVWPLRALRFSPHALPSEYVFSARSYAMLFNERSELTPSLALLASESVHNFLRLQLGETGRPEYVTSAVRKLPFPDLTPWAEELACLAAQGLRYFRSLCSTSETSPIFRCAASVANLDELRRLESEADALGLRVYGLNEHDLRSCGEPVSSFLACFNDEADDLEHSPSFWLGSAFGRWDIRYATSERQPPELPDPFDPLPVCPPAMLQNAEGLPAEPKDVPADYPLRISWPGILVDEENHPEDIVARVREAIEVIWKDRTEAIEQEACGILGVKTLRDYFRRPAAFFADHLKRYSKSRRQAPIYWPLSTKSGSYTLWLYYHRLTDQTLHTCLADFLDPKLRKVQSELDALTASGGGGTRAGELREFLDELHDLRDEIERAIKLPWKPNLNDGVLITASPLHKLFRLPKWQKDLKACWDKLAKGDYDWAHLAHTIWPTRVEKACETDRSIAIAHGLEHLCKVEPPKPKKKRAKKPTEDEEPDEDESELIEEG